MGIVITFSLLLLSHSASAQSLDWIKANYTKYEYRIAMRDGVRLFTAVYAPKDSSKKYPILLTRTPYSLSPYGPDRYRSSLGPSEKLAREGYIFVYQDVRGRWMSEGQFEHVRPYKAVKSGAGDVDEASDTWDTIDWLVKNIANHNGKVGMWGISYPGFYSAMGALDAHPALKAVSPQAPVSDWFIGDDFHHNGAFFLAHAFNFLINVDGERPEPTTQRQPPFQHGTPNGYEFFLRMGPLVNANEKYFKNKSSFWNEMTRHPNYDEFWKARSLVAHMKNIRPAVLNVGGWFDAEDVYGPLRIYEHIEKHSSGTQNLLVMGPWRHGQWAGDDGENLGAVRFNAKTSLYFRDQVEAPFFEYHLKGAGEMKLPEASVFETGTNLWRRHDTWPPRAARPVTLYFREEGKLERQAPSGSASAFDEYLSDPSRPVPTVDYIAIGMTPEYMVDDQRFAATRPDVLVYQTAPLEEDFTIAGPITASLHVSTTGTDADWVVKLIDVYPDDYPDPEKNPRGIRMGGYQQLLRGEPFRGRFRDAFDKPRPFTPGRVEKVEFVMPDVYHTFRRGHRVMVQVQSTWFPLVDRNPQKYVENIFEARDSDFQKATHRLWRDTAHPSAVRVLELK